ncbi:MAG TPA: hypothetical protein DHV28_17225 [Ignavibacteriales bacterium]|nr:hypothetical protein [Ignavibacteriales bacterium]
MIVYFHPKKMNDLKANEAEWRLTPEEIRSVKGYEDTNDEDIELIQRTLSLLALAFYEGYLMEQNKD